jgi:putative glutamine amidotransferase
MFSGRGRPVVGITGPDKGGFPAWFFTALAVWRAGGRPVRIRPGRRPELTRLDALILGGGADIDPDRYGEMDAMDEISDHNRKGMVEKHDGGGVLAWLMAPVIMIVRRLFSLGAIPVDTGRDQMEQDCLAYAVEHNLPVLGICRGAQFINVFWGGNLHREIAGFYVEIPKIESIYPRKTIEIISGTLLHSIVSRERCMVNSLHQQAVKDPGNEIIIAAVDQAGIVQAIEHKNYPFAVGVQWHPEYLPQVRSQQKIFRRLVAISAPEK